MMMDACEKCIFKQDSDGLTVLQRYFKNNDFSNSLRRVEQALRIIKEDPHNEDVKKYCENALSEIDNIYQALEITKHDIDFRKEDQ